MAKKKQNQNQGQRPHDTSNIDTDLFIKGMIKDSHESFVGQENWVHCRNCINNSVSGDAGTIGNEPANLICVSTGYTIIGAVYLFGDKWIVFSTDNTSSEIGLFDDSHCEYDTLVNDSCLNFNKFNLITGASKENFDCSWQIYWDDGRNPSRTLNIGPKDKIKENLNIPWLQAQVPGTGTDGNPCIDYVNLIPLQLNCDLIRLAPFMDTPKITLSKADSPGQLKNGSYQAYIAYTINEQQIGDYIGASNIQPLFDGDDTASSLDIVIENLDTNFDFYKIVLLMNNQQQTQSILVGLYSTHQSTINIDYINPHTASKSQVPISTLPLRTPVYERSNQMVVLNDYLMRIGPTTQFDFNYQPQANNITARWVSVDYPAEYYKNGGNKPSFMRDEQYAFFIRFVYNTGDKSTSYHIPGRAPMSDNDVFGDEEGGADGNNALNVEEEELWQTTNTAFVEEVDGVTPTDDGGIILSKGQMGYWQSTERYPAEDPHGRWGDLCGEPIRHHKFPEEQTDIDTLNRSSGDNQRIRVLGVEFDNITWPLFNPDEEGNQERIPNVVGYEILVGSRQGNKSILAKGIIRNMRSYAIPADGNVGADFDGDSIGLMPNYPFNDWGEDPYLSTLPPDGSDVGSPHASYPHNCGESVHHGTCMNFYTFHSPETSFNRPYLNPSEVKSYGMTTGLQQGHFKPSENHPKNVLIRDFAAIIAIIIGVAYSIGKMRGKSTRQLHTMTDASAGVPSIAAGFTIAGADTVLTGTSIVPPGPGIGEEAYMSGTTSLIALESSAASLLTSQLGPKRVVEFEGTDWKAGPNSLYGVLSIFGFINYVVDGGQVIIDLIYNASSPNNHAYKYNSYGLYSQTQQHDVGATWRNNVAKARYVGNVIQDFGSTDITLNARVNNLFRPATVVVQSTGNQGGNMLSAVSPDLSKDTLGGIGNAALANPTRGSYTSTIGAHYAGLKFAMDNQYGQLDGIKQIPISSPQTFLDEEGEVVTNLTTYDEQIFSSEPLFGGDVYINRYNEKVIMPFFWQFLNGEPDEFGFQYQNYMNAPYAMFYMDTTKYDLINMISPIFDFSFDWGDGGLPSTMHNMDRDATGMGTEIGNIAGGQAIWEGSGFGGYGTPANPTINNNFFILKRAYMYTHCSGVNDFFVESELNVGLRAQGGKKEEKFYDWTEYTSLNDLFHADIIDKGNFYKYDASLSKYNLTSQMISHGVIQPRDYDPFVAETCYDYYPKRILYSNQAFKEAKKDFWRVYLPNNYQDFKNSPTTIKPISKSGALVLFPHLAPLSFQGVDTLTTDYNTKLTIGDGGLFNDPMQQISTADLPHEYGSCENSRSVINTPSGVFFVSQAQGKIFNYGEGLKNITDAGMKQWFNSYLPSRLIAAYPEIEGTAFADNPVMGVGVQSVYDPNYDIVYFAKRDYEPCNVSDCIEFDPELPGFVYNETLCNDAPPNPECPPDYELNCYTEEASMQPIEICECCQEGECPEGSTINSVGQCCTTEYGETIISEGDNYPEGGYLEKINTIKPYTHDINKTVTFKVSDQLLKDVRSVSPRKFNLKIPFLNNENLVLSLERKSVLRKGYKVLSTNSKGETKPIRYKSQLKAYKVRGTSKKDKWRGTISFFRNGLTGTIRKNGKVYEISKDGNEYVLFDINNTIVKNEFSCTTESIREDVHTQMRSWNIDPETGIVTPEDPLNPLDYAGRAACITIAPQVDYYTYNQIVTGSGWTETELWDWVASIITGVSEIYEEELNVSLIQGTGHQWESSVTEPYQGIDEGDGSSEAMAECSYNYLQIFQDEWNGNGTSSASAELSTIERTVAMAFSTRRCGGRAYVNQLCNQSYAYGICLKLDTDFNPGTEIFSYLGGSSWTLKVTTHELGHICAGRHTHLCLYEPDPTYNFDGDGNGGLGAIDNCDGYGDEPPYSSGGCYDNNPWWVQNEVNYSGATDENGNVIDYGTIMSYCHVPLGYGHTVGDTDVPVEMHFKFHPLVKTQFINPAITEAADQGCATCPEIITEDCTDPSQLTEEWVQENINDVYGVGFNLTEYCMWCNGSMPTSPVDNDWGCTCCGSNPIPGCMDPLASNYNPLADIDDGSCIYPEGCTDPGALNYDENAILDDGSCIYCIYGCMNSGALNYDSSATCDDGSCEFPIIDCTDPLALNYNPEATTPCTTIGFTGPIENACCIYPRIGCMDPNALNYDPTAVESCPDEDNDGLPDCCEYPVEPPILTCECETGYMMVYEGTTNEVPLELQSQECLDPQVNVECIQINCESITDCIEPTYPDIVTEINLQNSEYFTDISWTVSYDPKIKGWISFHDWHPELSMSSHKHFLTTNTIYLETPYCPAGYTFDELTGNCENDGLSCFPGYELQDDEVTCCGNIFSGVILEEYVIDPEDSEIAVEIINPSFEMGFPNPWAEDPYAEFPFWTDPPFVNGGSFQDFTVAIGYPFEGIGVYTPLPWYRCMITDTPPSPCPCLTDEQIELYGTPGNQVASSSDCVAGQTWPDCYRAVECCTGDIDINNGQSEPDFFWDPPVLAQTPDVLPANWLNAPGNMIQVPEGVWGQTCGASEGDEYMGMVHACTGMNPFVGNWQEGLSQKTSQPFTVGAEYTATIDARDNIRTWAVNAVTGELANDDINDQTSRIDFASRVVIFGGYNPCMWDDVEKKFNGTVLFYSDPIESEPFGAGHGDVPDNCAWTTLDFTFIPTEPFDHVMIRLEGEHWRRFVSTSGQYDDNDNCLADCYDIYSHPLYRPNSNLPPHFYETTGDPYDGEGDWLNLEPGEIPPQSDWLYRGGCGYPTWSFKEAEACAGVDVDSYTGFDVVNFIGDLTGCTHTGSFNQWTPSFNCGTGCLGGFFDCDCEIFEELFNASWSGGCSCAGSDPVIFQNDGWLFPPSTPACTDGYYGNLGGGSAYDAAGESDILTNWDGSIAYGNVLPNGDILSEFILWNSTSMADYIAGVVYDADGNPSQTEGWMTDADGFPIPNNYIRTGIWRCCHGTDSSCGGCTDTCCSWTNKTKCRELTMQMKSFGNSHYINIDNLTAFVPTEEEISHTCECVDPDSTMVLVNVSDTQTVVSDATYDDCVNQELNEIFAGPDGDLMVTCVKEECYNLEDDWTEPSYESSGIWKHNTRCDLFNNYYNIQYPWEVELIESIGQQVNTVRSVEYQLEAYEYKPKVDEEGCIISYGCDDRWHDLMYNFDEAIVYNSEQNSGLLTLIEQTPDVNDIILYPIIGNEDIQILFKKVEQKYRFDQFWDNTADRSVSEPMFITQLNGYIRDLNEAYLDYNKPQLERKKFRHYVNNLILRKKVQFTEYDDTSTEPIEFFESEAILHTRKMILKLVNTKLNLSYR